MIKDRIVLLISLLFLSGCSSKTEESAYLSGTHVFVSDISWDTCNMDTFGSGEIIFLAPGHDVKIFCNSFLKDHDSLGWGEPGVILKTGKWTLDSGKIICKTQTIHRTFRMDEIEPAYTDTFYFENNLLRKHTKLYRPDPLMTEELSQFLRMDWGKLKSQ